MFGNIFAGLTILFTFGVLFECGIKDTPLQATGWIIAMLWAIGFLLRDVFEPEQEGQDILEKKHLDAFEKLMKAGDNELLKDILKDK
jgi:hypothetical protein